MKLTFKRQEKNKKRLSIFCDEEYLFSVSEYTFFKENLSDGMEIDDMDALKKRCNKAEFLNYALNILSRHTYTKKSLKDKLLLKGCDNESADTIICELEEKKILSDDSYKEHFIYEAQKYKKNGIRKIKQELYLKGITTTSEDFDHSLEISNVNDMVKYLISKKTNEKKIISRLMTKGYNMWDIISAIKNNKDTDIEYYE